MFLRSSFLLACCSLALLGGLTSGCGKKPAPQPVYTPNPSPLPADFAAAFDAYRPEGTRGWSFLQETSTRDQTILERHDASLPEHHRWTLLQKKGRPATEEEIKEYTEMLARRPRSDQAPNVRDQLLRDSWERLPDTAQGHQRFQFRLKPGGEDDHSAAFMAALFEFDPATQAIAAVELFTREPFRPTFGVQVTEARTRVQYHLPTADRPTLLEVIQVTVRGTAFWVKKLDQDMKVTYSDYALPPPPPAR